MEAKDEMKSCALESSSERRDANQLYYQFFLHLFLKKPYKNIFFKLYSLAIKNYSIS